MKAVSSGELTTLRSDLESACCVSTATHKRPTESNDGVGTSTVSWETIGTISVGLELPKGVTERRMNIYGESRKSSNVWLVHTPYDTDIQKHDQLIVEGKTLIIVNLTEPLSYNGLTDAFAMELS
jgi:hypothetical protein